MAERSVFRRRLDEARPGDESGRTWVYVPYDQLTHRVGPLSRLAADEAGIVLVESPWKASQRPYHRQKLALVLANQRRFALEQARRGVAVRHVVAEGDFASGLESVVAELGPLNVMRPAERELRVDLAPLVRSGALVVEDHAGWLTRTEDFTRAVGREPPFRMDAFYRHVRREQGVLMEDGAPVGGRYSFDGENRKTWSGDPPAPEPPVFAPDAVTEEVLELVRDRFGHHPGELRPEELPTTHEDAERLWRWALSECLESFGPYEDAMSRASRGLFHTRISPLLNLHRLLPRRVVDDVVASDAPLNSREGFVRQVLGWREFVRHVHERTDGFRTVSVLSLDEPGDGGWERWSGRAWERDEPATDGGAAPQELVVERGLPPAWWGTESGLACLDHEVAGVWERGWTHHIPRLMVLANVATLYGVSPRQLTDWFWAGYVDAYDWVVEPNVLAMGTYGVGEVMTTKPYVSGANYIRKMSDHCGACAFDPRSDCPLTAAYWAFLDRNADRLADNRRVSLPLASLRKRGDERRRQDRVLTELVGERLDAGLRLDPSDLDDELQRRLETT